MMIELLVGVCLFVVLLYWWAQGHSFAAVLMGVPMAVLGFAAGGNISGSVPVAMICAIAGMLLACVPWALMRKRAKAAATTYLSVLAP